MYVYIPEGKAARFEQGVSQVNGLITDSFSSCAILFITGEKQPFARVSMIHASRFTERKTIQQESEWVGEDYVIMAFIRPDQGVYKPGTKEATMTLKLLFDWHRKGNKIGYKNIDRIEELSSDIEAMVFDSKRDNVLALTKSDKNNLNILHHPQELKFQSIYRLYEIFNSKNRSNFPQKALIYSDSKWIDMDINSLRPNSYILEQYLAFINKEVIKFAKRKNQDLEELADFDFLQCLNTYIKHNSKNFIMFI